MASKDWERYLWKEIGKAIDGKYANMKGQDRAIMLNDIMGWVRMYAKDTVHELVREDGIRYKGKLPSQLTVDELSEAIGRNDHIVEILKKAQAL